MFYYLFIFVLSLLFLIIFSVVCLVILFFDKLQVCFCYLRIYIDIYISDLLHYTSHSFFFFVIKNSILIITIIYLLYIH